MRQPTSNAGLTVQAIAGTYVVLLGMSVEKDKADGLLGFAIERTDHTEGEHRVLANNLLFERNDTGATPDHSSKLNPVQEFVWGDYAAKPNHAYTYSVTAMYGTSAKLTPGAEATVTVTTEDPSDGQHAVFFNRGVAASAAYQQRFGTKRPSDVPNREAYRWLSRGLEEAIVAFIGQAANSNFALRAAFYEFNFPSVLEALRVADAAGADVQVVYDRVKGGPGATSLAAIKRAGIEKLMTERTKIAIAHNKFIVLLRDGAPVEVWTGSTNITEGGIFGHANVGHRIADPAVAQRYLDYWNELVKNPERPPFKAFDDPTPTFPAGRPRKGSKTAIFSPRTALDSLEWYVRLADSAQESVFLTAAFGLTAEVAPVFAPVVNKPRDYLRYLLLDTDKGKIEAVRRDPDNVVTAGGFSGKGAFRTWVAEALRGLNPQVRYIHTKFMLVDPLTDDSLIVTGSANWSNESSQDNDENMVVLRGNSRAADIYLTEFMRIFNHYRLRGKAQTPAGQLEPGPGVRTGNKAQLHLDETDAWSAPFFVDGSREARERMLFSGAAS